MKPSADRVLTVAVVVMAIAAVASAVRIWMPRETRPEPGAVGPFRPGDQLRGLQAGVLGTKTTAVLIFSTGCKVCQDSMDFYQRLARAAREDSDEHRLVVLAVDAPAETEVYLRAGKVRVHSILPFRPADMPTVTATPTLIVLDAAGRVRGSWTGLLPPQAESVVIDTFVGGQ